MKVTHELVQIFWQEGEKAGMLYQNGKIEMYVLKPASKQDVAALLEADNVETHENAHKLS